MNSRYQKTDGSAILALLIFVLILSSISGTYLSVANQELKMALRTARLQGAMNVAEAGAEEAIYSILKENWGSAGWSEIQSNEYLKSFSLTQYYNTEGIGKVYVNNNDATAPILLCEGRVTGSFGEVRKQIRIDLKTRGLFANGLTSKDGVTMNGNNVFVDSYNSNDGPYEPLINQNDRGTVGSVSVKVDAGDIQNAEIYGYVATGGSAPQVGSKGRIYGKDTPSGTKIDETRVSRDFYAEFESITNPFDMSSASTSINPNSTIGSPGASSPEIYKVHDLDVGSSDVLTIDGPVVIEVDDDFEVKGEVKITDNGKVQFYVKDDISVGGNGLVNENEPSRLAIFGMNTNPGEQDIKLHGNGALSAAVYAPYADLDLKGGGSKGVFFGAAVADEITMNGNYEFHYDEALDDFNTKRQFKIIHWEEIIAASDRADFEDESSLTNYVQP